jgi:hypothetical protein
VKAKKNLKRLTSFNFLFFKNKYSYVLKLDYQTDYSALFVDGAEALDEVLVYFIWGDDFK